MSYDERADYQTIIEGLKRHIIPDVYPPPSLWGGQVLPPLALRFRPEIVEASSWSLVSYEWVRPLAAWIGARRCLEIMCGRGVLTKALRDCGTSIIATDNLSMMPDPRWWRANTWIEDIERLDCVEAVEKYATSCEIVLCSWPPASDPSLLHALLKMREIAPRAQMVYIGTMASDINATKEFFNTVLEVADPIFTAVARLYRQMPGVCDLPRLFQ